MEKTIDFNRFNNLIYYSTISFLTVVVLLEITLTKYVPVCTGIVTLLLFIFSLYTFYPSVL